MPCNQFMRREPGHVEEIKAFVKSRGFIGTVMEQGSVNGPETHPVWVFLKVGLYSAAGPTTRCLDSQILPFVSAGTWCSLQPPAR